MLSALGLTGVPVLSPTGKPLEEHSSEMATYVPPLPWSQKLALPLLSLPPTPDASPCEWDQNLSRGPTPVGHVSAIHPANAPLYGLGFPPSLFEDHENAPQVISVRGGRASRPELHTAPPLNPPPFHNARPRRSTISLPEWTPDLRIAPLKTTTLRQRQQRAQRNRKLLWAVVMCWTIFIIFGRLAHSSFGVNWRKHNAQWSAQLNHFKGDSLYGLEEDFTPITPHIFFHRTQRGQYERYLAKRPHMAKGPSSTEESGTSAGGEDDLHDVHLENPSFSTRTTTSSTSDTFAISKVIDSMLLWPDLEPYTSRRGDPRDLYHEALVALNEVDPIINIGVEEMLSLLQQTDKRRRWAIEAMLRRVKARKLPFAWRSKSSLDTLMRRIWTQAETKSDIFDEDTFEGKDDWNEDLGSSRDVVIITRGVSPRLTRIQELLRSHHNIEATVVNLAERDDGDIIETLLHRLTGNDALPHLLIGSESFGKGDGHEILQSEQLRQERLGEERS